MQQLNTKLVGVVNETDIIGLAMTSLIQNYLQLPTLYGFRAIGDEQPTLQFPCLMVEPSPGQNIELDTTGKYHLQFTFNIYWYVVDNNPQDVVSLYSSIGETLIKLFSNNALNDLDTVAPPSHNFCAYEPYWTDVTKMQIHGVPTFPNPLNGNGQPKWMRRGRMIIEVEKWVIK